MDGKLEKADLHFLGKANRARMFADSYSKVGTKIYTLPSFVYLLLLILLLNLIELDANYSPNVRKLSPKH